MKEQSKKSYSVPMIAFESDIKKCIKGSTNYMTKKKREKALNQLCAFWIMLSTNQIDSFKDKEDAVWVSSVVMKAIGFDFKKLFDKLHKINKNRYVIKRDLNFFQVRKGFLPRFINYYKIVNGAGELGKPFKFTEVEEDTEQYCKINDILNHVEEAIKKEILFGQNNLRPSENEVSKRYYEMTLDEEKSIAMLEMRYGISLADALYYKEHKDKSKNKDILQKQHKADVFYSQYEKIKLFNKHFYKTTAKFGRIYTGLHNLIKEVRNCLYNSKHERMVELWDMHGAHIVGFLSMCSSYEKMFGNSKRASMYSDYILDVDKDPYRFALIGRFEKERDVVKDAVFAFAFASYQACTYRGKFIVRMKEMKNYDEVLDTCVAFKNVMETYDTLNMSKSLLKSVFSDVKFSPEFYYVVTGYKINSLSLYNGGGVNYSSIDNNKAKADIKNGVFDLSVFSNLIDSAYTSMLHYHIEKCFIKQFGYDSLATCTGIRIYFRDKSKKIKDKVNSIIKKNNSEVSFDDKGNTPNASVMCQIAEGWTLFDNVVPELVENTGCKDIVTFHDAILVPKSVARKVNVKELNIKVLTMFIANVEYIFKHVDEYFNGEIEAPFSYLVA